MTSVEWVFEPQDSAARTARRDAMNVADAYVRGRSFPKDTYSALEIEAIALRRSEVTWAEVMPGKPVMVVQVKMTQIFWAVLLAQLTVGVLVALFFLLNRL